MSITISEFKQRREQLLAFMPANSVALITAAAEVTRSRDTEYAFRQNSDFQYLTGFPEPDAILVLVKSDDDISDHLYCRSKDKVMEIWQGRRVGPIEAKSQFGFEFTSSLENLEQALLDLLNGTDSVMLGLGENDELTSLVNGCMARLRSGGKRGWKSPTQLIDIAPLIHEMRLIKSDAEIEIMKQSSAISIAAHRRAMRFAAEGKTEYQLEAELHHEFAMNGARHPAYGTIVGSGENACILHYTENADVLSDGDLILIDAGSEYHGYAADITRTFPVNGKFSEAQRDIYDLVLDAQMACIDMVKPGVTLQQVGETAAEILTNGLVELGLLQGDADDLIESQAYKAFYMHGIGHWLGLDVHDVGEYKSDDKDRPFEAGMVMTIEPGLYIDEDAEVDACWKNIGVRIEDNILVTETGHINLTEDLEKSVKDIETLMAG